MSTDQLRTRSEQPPPAAAPVRRGWLVLLWAVVGATLGVGLGAAFTPLILLVVPASVLGAVLLSRTGLRREVFAAPAGLGLLPLLIGWLWSGPGWDCTDSDLGQTCVDAGSGSVAWLLLGALLVVGGLVVALRRPRRLR